MTAKISQIGTANIWISCSMSTTCQVDHFLSYVGLNRSHKMLINFNTRSCFQVFNTAITFVVNIILSSLYFQYNFVVHTDTHTYTTQRALYVGTTSKFSLEQRHYLISATFQRCSNVRCLLARDWHTHMHMNLAYFLIRQTLPTFPKCHFHFTECNDQICFIFVKRQIYSDFIYISTYINDVAQKHFSLRSRLIKIYTIDFFNLYLIIIQFSDWIFTSIH